MWRHRGGDEEDEEAASSFASSQSRSVDSASESQSRDELHGQRDMQHDSDEDAYDDEDFEGYSDEFESDDEEADTAAQPSTDCVWKVGDCVQVYWNDERTWFDGVVGRVDKASRCFVHYADGEQQWEELTDCRGAPPTHATGADQLQQIHGSTDVSSLVGRRVVVYWQEGHEWFHGRIEELSRASGEDQIRVTYDDGDGQWLPAGSFRDVLVLSPASKRGDSLSESTDHTTCRVLTPRPYIMAVEHHFEPIRVARPYKTTIPNHVGSVITPRSSNRRPYYHPRVAVQLDCAPQLPGLKRDSFANASRECEVQTEISLQSELGDTSSATTSA